MAGKNELEKLIKRWERKTGDAMPTAILDLPIDRVRRAVELVEAGAVVAVPKEPCRLETPDPKTPEDSMMDWDEHGQF